MTNPLVYVLKIYALILVLPGVAILIKLNKYYISGFLLGFLLVLLDVLLLSLSFKRRDLTYVRVITYTLLRILILSLVILLLFTCGIINKLNIIGVFIALLLYPLALVIGGIKVLKWKR